MAEAFEFDLYNILRECHLLKRLNDDQVQQLAESLPVEAIREDSLIFEQASQAQSFYFVLNGRVRLVLVDNRQEYEMGLLEEGDYFGQDALHAHGFNAIQAVAATNVTVAVLSHDHYRRLIRQFPLLEHSFEAVYRSYRLGLQQDFSWRGPRESIQYISRIHPFFLLLKLLAPLFVLAFSVVLWVFYFGGNMDGGGLIGSGLVTAIGLGWLFWNLLDWTNDYVIITNRRVIYQQRVVLMYESQQEAPLEAILSDDINTTFWGRWIGYGSLVVKTFTGSLILPRLPNPREVKMILAERRLRATTRGRSSRRDMMQDIIRRRLNGDPNAQIPQEDQLLPAQVKLSPLQAALNDLLLMRWERGDAIIYRTHWLILLSKILVPVGLVLLFTALLVWGAIMQNFIVTSLFLVFILLILAAAIVLLIYKYADWANDQYIITKNELVDVFKKPLGKEDRRSAPISNIQSINHTRKNLIALIFNFGTVFIRVGDDTLSFDNVPNPAVVQREIFDRFWEQKQAKEKHAADEEQERMVEWLEAYDEVRRENGQ